MSHTDHEGFIEISGPYATAWAIWTVFFVLGIVLTVPPVWMGLILLAFLFIEIPGALGKSPEDENHEIARTFSQMMQRIAYAGKKARAIPLSWAALAVLCGAGMFAWKTYWVVTSLSFFGTTVDKVAGGIIAAAILLWNIPHWWDRENFG